LLSQPRCDVVINLGSRASRSEWEAFPIDVLTTNADGTRNLLERARSWSAKYICMSTSDIYGDPEVVPTPESYLGGVSTTSTRSSYDEGKRYSESLVMAYHREHLLDTVIIRLFNTYGPRIRGGDAFGRVIPRFVEQAIANSPLTVYGDGSQTRTHVYVDDVIDPISRIILSNLSGEVFNIGGKNEISVQELARTIIKLTGSSSRIEYLPLPDSDPKRRCPDISHVSNALGWTPKVSLEDGLTRFISWYRAALTTDYFS
jgi:UDP-glucuronate decarboxylase